MIASQGIRALLIARQALTAPFILRIYAMSKHGVFPKSLKSGLDVLPNFSKWAAEVIKQESVTYIWDEERIISRTVDKINSMKEKAKAASK